MGLELTNNHITQVEDGDVHIPGEETFYDAELGYHIRTALESAKKGDKGSYNQLVGMMHHNKRLKPDEVAALQATLAALSRNVTCIDVVHHHNLLKAIFGMSLWNYGTDVMDTLIEFITSLAASSGKYIDLCLDMLINNFVAPYYFLDKLKRPWIITKKNDVLSRVHAALDKIYNLFPLAPSRLLPILLQRMPNVHKQDKVILLYVENMLKLANSSIGEIVGGMIVMLVMERLRDLDVEIGWDDILQEDSGKGIFDMEEADDVVECGDGDEVQGSSLNRKSLIGNTSADLLDKLMVLTFEHLESCRNDNTLTKVFKILLCSFEVHLLTTFKSKFSQFVIFYACALDPENCGMMFATKLADIFVCGENPPFKRMSAVAYLASYLARGNFLSASSVVDMLKRVVDWCYTYCKAQDGEVNPQAHGIFYSGCQAIMYVLCFRMKSIMDVPRLKSQFLSMPLELILKHKLFPLKVCLSSIVEEFLRQAKAAHLFGLSDTTVFKDLFESELSSAFGGPDRLDMFFPFDPCLLKQSDSYLLPNFVHWSMVITTCDENDDENDSDYDDDAPEIFVNETENFMDDDDMASSFDEQDPDLDYALNKMSITPKNSLKLKSRTQMPSRIRPSMSPEPL